ncbi:unnamed protein product, partial [Amoebophrya sp. A25]|eukprot:GSA25T00015695001.1
MLEHRVSRQSGDLNFVLEDMNSYLTRLSTAGSAPPLFNATGGGPRDGHVGLSATGSTSLLFDLSHDEAVDPAYVDLHRHLSRYQSVGSGTAPDSPPRAPDRARLTGYEELHQDLNRARLTHGVQRKVRPEGESDDRGGLSPYGGYSRDS